MYMHECPKWVITTVHIKFFWGPLQLTSARAPIVHAKACPVYMVAAMQLLTHAEAEGISGEMLPQELRHA